jgi:hypothetical protein
VANYVAQDIGRLCAERQWSRARLMLELRRAADRRRKRLPGDDSLKRMIREWVHGRRGLSEFYALILGDAFGVVFGAVPVVSAALTADQPESVVELLQRLDAACIVDAGLVRLFEDQTQKFRLLDRRLGAANLLAQTEAHVNQIVDLLSFTVPGGHRTTLGAAGAEAAALAGWQALDLGDPMRSWKMHEVAKAAAHDAENLSVLAHVTAQQAYPLLDLDRPRDALVLVQHAREIAGSAVPDQLRSWLLAAEGEILAACGDGLGAQRALDDAARLLPGDVSDDLPYLALDSGHLARWRGHCLARLGSSLAVESLTAAVATMAPEFTRAHASLYCDLALAFAMRGEDAEAREAAQRAASLASASSSARQRKRISKLLVTGL